MSRQRKVAVMLSIDDVRARLARLEQLSLGLAKEKAVIQRAEDPLLYLERRRYLCAIDDARFGVEAARVVLARALMRLREGEAGREGRAAG